MSTVGDKIKENLKSIESDADQWLGLTQVGTFLNLMEEGVEELRDDEVQEKFTELQELVITKREELWNKEIEEEHE